MFSGFGIFFSFVVSIVVMHSNSTTLCFVLRRQFKLFGVLFQLYESWTFAGLSRESFLF